MRGRGVALALLALLLLHGLVVPVLAADGEDDGGLWSIVDAIGGFFSKLATTLLEGLKRLFIPRYNFFSEFVERIQSKLTAKFGGVSSMFTYLRGRFRDIRAYPGLGNLLTLRFDSGHFLAGNRVNLIAGIDGVMLMIKGAFTGFLTLWTAAHVHRKVVEQINT